MISKKSIRLSLLPIKLGTLIFITPLIWNKKKRCYESAIGIRYINWVVSVFLNCIGRIGLTILHVEAVVNGHANITEVVVCSFLIPLYWMSIAFQLSFLALRGEVAYFTNQWIKISKQFGKIITFRKI